MCVGRVKACCLKSVSGKVVVERGSVGGVKVNKARNRCTAPF